MKIYYLLFIDASSAFTNGPKLIYQRFYHDLSNKYGKMVVLLFAFNLNRNHNPGTDPSICCYWRQAWNSQSYQRRLC